jgi:hypothetical protein
MASPDDEFTVRVSDMGRWFDPGIRVDLTRPTSTDGRHALELAALGAYEVSGCERVVEGHRRWLDVRVQRAFSSTSPPGDRAQPPPPPAQERPLRRREAEGHAWQRSS